MFNIILSVVTLVTGLIWLGDRLWLARRRREAGKDKPDWFTDFCVSLFPVIFAVFMLRSFLVEPFRIPSPSMVPTLHVGDFILVNKFAYGLRCPVGSCMLVPVGEPKRGDVVVFRYPGRSPEDTERGTDFIKRVVGVPGDHVVFSKKVLAVNGQTMPLTFEGKEPGQEQDRGVVFSRYTEDLSGVRHLINLDPGTDGMEADLIVPAHAYFMMGDNRDRSFDSRFWGPAPEVNLRGKAFFIWMSWDNQHFRPDFSRLGLVIH